MKKEIKLFEKNTFYKKKTSLFDKYDENKSDNQNNYYTNNKSSEMKNLK
jgi:hypothetical protein